MKSELAYAQSHRDNVEISERTALMIAFLSRGSLYKGYCCYFENQRAWQALAKFKTRNQLPGFSCQGVII